MVSPCNETNQILNNRSNKKKYKKDALDFVDYELEFQKDPKFKTELCKTFMDTGFCAYGNKCRFAHGKEDLFQKLVGHPKYRKSDCITFHSNGYCNYGQRCHFRHHELRCLTDIPRSYYSYLLNMYHNENKIKPKRLCIFDKITGIFLPYQNDFSKGFINNLRRLIDSQDQNSNNYSQKKRPSNPRPLVMPIPPQRIFSDRKTSSSSKSKSPFSINSISPENSFINNKFGNGEMLNQNLNKKLNFNNLDEIPYFQ